MPEWVTKHTREASAWVCKRKKWCAAKVTWSIHRTTKKLDREGCAAVRDFWDMTHNRLIAMVELNLTQNNKCRAIGSVQERTGCIPMGGPFSARSADLHCIFCTYKWCHHHERLGFVSNAGIAYWVRRWIVALCQFGDNVVVATDAPSTERAELVELARDVLQEA